MHLKDFYTIAYNLAHRKSTDSLYHSFTITASVILGFFLLIATSCSAIPAGLFSGLGTQTADSEHAANGPDGAAFHSPQANAQSMIPFPEISPTAHSSPTSTNPDNQLLEGSPFPVGTPMPHPKQTSSLLFLSRGNLMRWDYVTGYSGTLVEGVASFSASSSGKQIALVRPRKISANGVELYDLALLDFDSMHLATLVEKISQPVGFAISPDGNWVAYLLAGKPASIYKISSDAASQPIQLGSCSIKNQAHCQTVVWSPDSQSIAWMDAQGIWLSALQPAIPKLVSPTKVEITDPKGKKSVIEVNYDSLSWAPSGRYLLTRLVTSSRVSWQAILDTRTGRLAEVPDTFGQDKVIVSLGWLHDGSLIVTGASDPIHSLLPYIKVWQVYATSNNLLASYKKFDFQSDQLPQIVSQIKTIPTICLSWPAELQEQKIAFATTMATTSVNPMLFTLDLNDGGIQKLLEIPSDTTDVLWAPDGGGALVIGPRSGILFIPLSRNVIHNVTSLVGSDAHGFKWLPPEPRF